jgi:hypothetical protein
MNATSPANPILESNTTQGITTTGNLFKLEYKGIRVEAIQVKMRRFSLVSGEIGSSGLHCKTSSEG